MLPGTSCSRTQLHGLYNASKRWSNELKDTTFAYSEAPAFFVQVADAHSSPGGSDDCEDHLLCWG